MKIFKSNQDNIQVRKLLLTFINILLEKKRWFNILNSMPAYIMSYDVLTKKVKYINNFVKTTMFPKKLDWE
jgi:hypothetical protein